MITRNCLFVVAVIALSAVLLSPNTAEATTYYVATTGTDSNPCSQSQPCLTIGHGITVAAGTGNVLYVASGTYTESPTISSGGNAGNKFSVQGFAPGGNCPTTASADPFTPRGARPTPTAIIIGHVSLNANYVQFQCFEVEPNPSEGITYQPNYNANANGINVAGGQHDVDIFDNYIHKTGSFVSLGPTDGTHVFSKAINAGDMGSGQQVSNVDIEHNFTRLGGAQQTGINCTSSCLFKDNEEFGVEDDVDNDVTFDADYNEMFGGGISEIHNYMHGADQAFVGATRHNAHIDCFEWTGGVHDTVIDRNVCFNENEGAYFDDCSTKPISSCPYGTYNSDYNLTITNNIFAFGPGSVGAHHFGICLTLFHAGHVKFDNNICWGTYVGIDANSQLDSFENNIMYQTYQTFSGRNCTPYVAGDQPPFPDSSTFGTHQKNILWEDTQCPGGVPNSGLYVNDIRNVDPLWNNPSTYTDIPDSNPGTAHDFHLQSISSAIRVAAILSWVTDDLDGNARTNTSDIGPYSGTAPPTSLRVTIN